MVLQRVIVLLSVSVLLAASVREEEEEIGELEQEQEQDMEMDEERKEQSIYVSTCNFPDHSVEPIKGKRDGTIWIIVDKSYVCVKNNESKSGSVFRWEC